MHLNTGVPTDFVGWDAERQDEIILRFLALLDLNPSQSANQVWRWKILSGRHGRKILSWQPTLNLQISLDFVHLREEDAVFYPSRANGGASCAFSTQPTWSVGPPGRLSLFIFHKWQKPNFPPTVHREISGLCLGSCCNNFHSFATILIKVW